LRNMFARMCSNPHTSLAPETPTYASHTGARTHKWFCNDVFAITTKCPLFFPMFSTCTMKSLLFTRSVGESNANKMRRSFAARASTEWLISLMRDFAIGHATFLSLSLLSFFLLFFLCLVFFLSACRCLQTRNRFAFKRLILRTKLCVCVCVCVCGVFWCMRVCVSAWDLKSLRFV